MYELKRSHWIRCCRKFFQRMIGRKRIKRYLCFIPSPNKLYEKNKLTCILSAGERKKTRSFQTALRAQSALFARFVFSLSQFRDVDRFVLDENSINGCSFQIYSRWSLSPIAIDYEFIDSCHRESSEYRNANFII